MLSQARLHVSRQLMVEACQAFAALRPWSAAVGAHRNCQSHAALTAYRWAHEAADRREAAWKGLQQCWASSERLIGCGSPGQIGS